MRFLSRLILMSICFELLISPIKPELVMVTVLKANAAETCAQGMEWSDAANRCLVKASTAQTQRDLEACEKLSGEEQKSCYEKNANNALGDMRIDNLQDMYDRKKLDKFKGQTAVMTAMYALPTMFFTYFLIKNKKNNVKCYPPSAIAMMAAAVISGAGEVIGIINHKKNLKKLNKQRETITRESSDNKDQQKVNATELQSEAFQLLADEQASIAKLAKMKQTFYTVASAAYGATAILATYELVSINMARAKWLAAQASPSPQTQATAPALKAKYDTLQQKYTCGQSAERDEIDTDKSFDERLKLENIHDNNNLKYKSPIKRANDPQLSFNLRDLKYLNTQTKLIQTASDLESLVLLTNELEEMKNGSVESQYTDHYPANDVSSDLSFLPKLYSNTALNNIYSSLKGDSPKLNTDKDFATEVLKIVSNHFLIPIAFAQNSETNTEHSTTTKTTTKTTTTTTDENGKSTTVETIIETIVTGAAPVVANKALGGGEGGKSAPQSGNISNPADGATTSTASNSQELNVYKGKTDKFLYSPITRIAFGGVLGGLTLAMRSNMKRQKEAAEERSKKLLELKADFNNTQGMKICTPNERNDQKQPGCYCYTSEGARNTNRSNSTICQNLWNSLNMSNMSYLTGSDSGLTTCITQNNQLDESCSCRKSNTCLKASGFNISGISTGTLSSLNGGLTPLNAVANGNAGQLNEDAILNSAMKLREAGEKLLKDNSLAAEKKAIDVASKDLNAFVNKNGGTIPSPSSRSIPTSLANFNAKAALEEIKKEVESSPTISGSGMSDGGFDTGSQEPSLEFGLTEDEAAIQEEQVAEVLKQDMDLGNNDISGSTTNLFEVLSHRYQRSGMRRLFDIEGKTEAEQPAATDINK